MNAEELGGTARLLVGASGAARKPRSCSLQRGDREPVPRPCPARRDERSQGLRRRRRLHPPVAPRTSGAAAPNSRAPDASRRARTSSPAAASANRRRSTTRSVAPRRCRAVGAHRGGCLGSAGDQLARLPLDASVASASGREKRVGGLNSRTLQPATGPGRVTSLERRVLAHMKAARSSVVQTCGRAARRRQHPRRSAARAARSADRGSSSPASASAAASRGERSPRRTLPLPARRPRAPLPVAPAARTVLRRARPHDARRSGRARARQHPRRERAARLARSPPSRGQPAQRFTHDLHLQARGDLRNLAGDRRRARLGLAAERRLPRV